jgi:3-mercaptopyruvate sulfurtransferase SseA
MNTRVKISVLLVGLGVLLAFIPGGNGKTFRLKPGELVEKTAQEKLFTVDEVARFVNNEDSTVQIIDVRSEVEFMACNIPGSVNIPLEKLTESGLENMLTSKNVRTIFYSNDDLLALMALTIATGMGTDNVFVMKGGLNEWFQTVMLSEYSGETITARENALFENRFKARVAFNQFNSLPDSLKTKYFDAKRLQQKKLDGGC